MIYKFYLNEVARNQSRLPGTEKSLGRAPGPLNLQSPGKEALSEAAGRREAVKRCLSKGLTHKPSKVGAILLLRVPRSCAWRETEEWLATCSCGTG